MVNTLKDFVFGQSTETYVLSAIILSLAVVAVAVVFDRRASIKKYIEHRKEVRIQRGLLMGRKAKAARLKYIKDRFGEAITEFGENEFLAGRMTREEVNAFYRAIGKTHHIPDLIPVLTPAQAKSAIKYRRSQGYPVLGQEKPAWGDPPAVNGQPEETQTNVINATKRFGDKALSLLKKTA